MIAVSCKAVTKTYHSNDVDTFALRGIDLEINVGELFMLVGPSGCGKTTLISIVAGILNNDQGNCIVFDTNLKNLSESARTRFRGENIGFVFQAFNLIPTLTCTENVGIPLLLRGASSTVAKKKADELLERVGLGHKFSVLPRELSGGQQQRVAIARALVHGPKLIVCDEPTSSLDKESGQSVMQLFREIALSQGGTLIVVTHDNRIFHFADRIAEMNDGRIERVLRPEPGEYLPS